MDGKTVLVVDDNLVNLKILSKILSEDYHVIEAKNGKEALDKIISLGCIDVIILDLIMPVMNGFELLKFLKESKDYNNIPIIITTGSGEEENEIKALEYGAWDFVAKP